MPEPSLLRRMPTHQSRGFLEYTADLQQAYGRLVLNLYGHIHRLTKYDVSE
jgi:hypothetical protein